MFMFRKYLQKSTQLQKQTQLQMRTQIQIQIPTVCKSRKYLPGVPLVSPSAFNESTLKTESFNGLASFSELTLENPVNNVTTQTQRRQY